MGLITGYTDTTAVTSDDRMLGLDGGATKLIRPNDVGKYVAGRLGVFNVLDYGAVGDGVTDDTAAIQAASDAVSAAGAGLLKLPPDYTYAVSGIQLGTNVTMDATGATIHRISNTAATSPSDSTVYATSGTTDVTIIGARFTSATSQTGSHLGADNVTRLTIRDVRVDSHSGMWATWFRNCTDVAITRYRQDSGTIAGEDGLHFTGGSRIAISDCVISSGDDCIAFTNNQADQENLTDVTISNCVLTSAVATLVKIHILSGASTGRVIRDMHISGITGECGTSARALSITNDKGVNGTIEQITVAGFHADCSAGTASALGSIYLLAANEIAVQDATLVDPNQDGVYAESCDNLRLHNVHVISAVRHGIVVHKANHSVIDACHIDDPGTHGIQVGFSATGSDACEATTITNSRVFSAASTGIYIRNANRSVVAFNRLDTCGLGLDDDNTLGLTTLWFGNDTTGCTTAHAIVNRRFTVTGSRAGNAALASLLTQLVTAGLITDSTTA